MTVSDDDRLIALERELQSLASRLERVERELGVPQAASRAIVSAEPEMAPPSGAAPPIRPPRPPQPARQTVPPSWRDAARQPLDVEELLGGRLLAIVGGVAVLLGLAFFVALAVDRGWIGETARVVLAFAGAGALLGAGAWLFEAKGRSQAALAMIGTGIAGLYLTLTAATALYELVPTVVGLAAALAIGALATSMAVRFGSRTVAALGILGALAAPVLVDAADRSESLPFLAIAHSAAAGVLLWRRWDWLRIAAFAVTMAQVAFWALDDASGAAVAVVLALFAAINLVLAVGYELRVPTAALRPSSVLLVSANALVAGGVVYLALAVDADRVRAAGIWIAALSVAHLASGIALLIFRKVSRDVGVLLLGVALASADVAFALLVDGPALAVGWAISAAGLAVLARRYPDDADLVSGTLGSQLALAIGHTLMFDAPAETAIGDAPGPGAFAAMAAITVSAFAAARLAGRESDMRRAVFDGVSLAALAYATAVALDGVSLVVAYGAQAGALVQVSRRTKDRVATGGALFFLALAAAHVLVFEARPDALVYGVDDLGAAVLALAVVAGAAAVATRAPEITARLMYGVAGAALVYLGSVVVVDAFQPGGESLGTGLDLDIRQQGQAILSGFWSICGLGLLAAGLRVNVRDLRLAGFALLALAVGKVFIYDLSALESAYRVLSFIVLGILLLLAAFAYQRMRRETSEEGPRTAPRSS